MLELIAKTSTGGPASDVLRLPYDLRQRSRQRVRLESGREAALLLVPGTTLEEGDALCSPDGVIVQVQAAAEEVATAHSHEPLLLARACYHLGNRHVALQVGAGWLRFQPDHVLEEMVRGLGMEVRHERAPFEPEHGAYHASSRNGHAHAHPHTHEHEHEHEHTTDEHTHAP